MCTLWQTAIALMESLTWGDLVGLGLVVIVITGVVERVWIERTL